MTSRTAQRLILVLALLAAPGCVSRSGRLDPFPAETGGLHPSAPTVGILRFGDAREHPDWVADRLRSIPPPRVFFEEAALAAIQKQGMNGLILTLDSDATPEETAALASEMGLDAVLSGKVTGCAQVARDFFGFNGSIRIGCLIDYVLRDPQGKALYSSSAHGEATCPMTLNGTPDDLHRAFAEAVRKATTSRIDAAFAETVRRSIRERKGTEP